MEWIDLAQWVERPMFAKMIHTLIMTLIILILQRMARTRVVRDMDMDQGIKRKWMVTFKNISFFIWMFFMVVIWIQQLQAIGATVVVFAAAIVVATKEFILNIVGYIYRSGTKSFSIGDRIEINGIRGDVLDQNITGVLLLEVGSGVKTHQYTGSSVFFPNAVFLSSPVRNETIMGGDYVFHIITVTMKNTEDWQIAEQALLEAAQETCRPYLNEAVRHMTSLSRRHALDQPGVEPRINIQIPDHNKITLQLRIPVPSKRRGRMEGEVLRSYLIKLKQLKERQLSEKVQVQDAPKDADSDEDEDE